MKRRTNQRVVDGILLLDKPQGLTSNQALQTVRRLFRARKAGHTGSLDPLATGMLPICFGQATKLSAYFLDADKSYRVTASWGERTDTADADGSIVEHNALAALSRQALEAALTDYRGEIEQIPPMYSALKKEGRRLYELAREGKTVARDARRVVIKKLEVDHYDPEHPVLAVECSKGTYIRTLIEDIAAAAGTLGHVHALRRPSVHPFREQDLVTLDTGTDLAEKDPRALDELLIPVDQAIADWPALELSKTESHYLLQGNPITGGPETHPGLVRLSDEARHFLGIGEVLRDGRIAPKRLFVGRSGPGA